MKIYMTIGLVLSGLLVAGLFVFDGDVNKFIKSILEELFDELDIFAVFLMVAAVIIGIAAIWAPYLVWVIMYVIKGKIESNKNDKYIDPKIKDLGDDICKEFN